MERYTKEEIRELALELIENNFNSYFSIRNIASEILAKKYNISLKKLFKDPDLKKEYLGIIRQLGHIIHDLKKKGLIEPYSRTFYKKIKVI